MTLADKKFRFATFLLVLTLACGFTSVARAEAKRPAAAKSTKAAPLAAAVPEKPVNIGPILSRAYEERAKTVLERFIPAREFSVDVKAEPTAKPLNNAPYEPRALTAGTLQNLTPEELDAYVARVEVDVMLSARLRSSQRKVEELLTRELKLDKTRGDRIRLGSLGLDIEPDSWTKEKTDLKQDLSLAKEANSKLSRELELAKIEAANAKAAEQAAKDARNAKDAEKKPDKAPESYFKEFWKENQKPFYIAGGIIIGAFVLLVIALLFIGRSFAVAGRTMGGSIALIAQAMDSVGGSLANIGSGGSNNPQKTINTLEAKMISEGGGKGSGMASLPIESIQAHLLKAREEILANLNDGTEALILRYLTTLCQNQATVFRAVVALEVMGRDEATKLFVRLGYETQEAIMKFLREGIYARSKLELMLEAVEELKTKLLVESFDKVRRRPSEKVAERLIQLNEDDVVQVASELDPILLPRFFLYLDSGKIANLLIRLKSLDPKQFEKGINVLSQMPEAESVEKYDEDILKALEAIINRTKNDNQRPFLKIYQEIVEATEGDVAEEILKTLSINPRVDNYLRENILSINTFFQLNDEPRAEIIETLSNKDVAALSYGSKPDQKDLITRALTERRKPLVEEELESLTSRGGRQANFAFKRVKDTIVKKIKDMKAEGTLVLGDKRDSKPIGRSSTKAAAPEKSANASKSAFAAEPKASEAKANAPKATEPKASEPKADSKPAFAKAAAPAAPAAPAAAKAVDKPVAAAAASTPPAAKPPVTDSKPATTAATPAPAAAPAAPTAATPAKNPPPAAPAAPAAPADKKKVA